MPTPRKKAKPVEPPFGARFLRPGFGMTPADDLAFALGHPHLCALTDREVAADDDDALREAMGRMFLFDLPRSLAPRVARFFALTPIGPQNVEAAMAKTRTKTGPLRAAEARRIAGKRTAGMSYMKDHQLMPLLEALVGTEVVVEAIVAALETYRIQDFHAWNRGAIQITRWGIGFGLLRCPDPAALELRARLEVVHDRAVAAAAPDKPEQLRKILDVVLHGAAGAERSGYRNQGEPGVAAFDLQFVHDDQAYVLGQIEQHRIDALWAPSVRLAFLGGEPAVAHYCQHWRKIRDGDQVTAFVREFGRIRSPAVARAIEEIAATPSSPAAAAAAAWLSEQQSARPS